MTDKYARVWSGTEWVNVSSPIASPNAVAVYQSTAPSSPVTGQIWVNSDDNISYVWNGSSWGATSSDLSSVVHIAGTETITGEKTFNNIVNVTSQNNEGVIKLGDISEGTSSTDHGIVLNNQAGTISSGMFTEVDGQILSYGINVSQMTSRDITRTGGIFRFDTRPTGEDSKEFHVIGQPSGLPSTGGVNEFSRVKIKLDTGLSGVNNPTPQYMWDVSGTTRTYGLNVSSIATPLIATGVASTTGGNLASGTYYIRIVAVDNFGNTTLPGPESVGVVTTGTTSSIRINWSQVFGAETYRIYVSTTSGSYSSYQVSSVPTFILITTTGTAGSLPVANNTGNVGIGTTNPGFKLDVSGTGNFTGILTAPTAAVGTNTTQVATTAFVTAGFEKTIPLQSSAPSSPASSDLWVDNTSPTSPTLKVYNGTSWITAGSSITADDDQIILASRIFG